VELQSLLSIPYGSAIAATVGGVTLLFKLVKPLFKAMDFHDKHFVRKHLLLLKAIRSSASKNVDLKQYLDDAIQLETFRIASGITTSRAKMEFLIRLSRDGVWTRRQIRSTSKFLTATPGEPEPSITFTWPDRVSAVLGISSAMITLVVGTLYLVQSMLQGGFTSSLVGLSLFSICVVIGTFFALDFINYRVAKRVREHLRLTENTS